MESNAQQKLTLKLVYSNTSQNMEMQRERMIAGAMKLQTVSYFCKVVAGMRS